MYGFIVKRWLCTQPAMISVAVSVHFRERVCVLFVVLARYFLPLQSQFNPGILQHPHGRTRQYFLLQPVNKTAAKEKSFSLSLKRWYGNGLS